jgi:cytoskeletal protein CcmA (bactofilin family)
MNMRSWRLAAAPLALLLAALPVSALAADVRSGNEVTIAPGQTVTDDLYIWGGTLRVAGTVDGNLTVMGGTVEVPGTVTRDLTVAGGTVTVPGRVGGSVRTAGGTVTVAGQVGEDLLTTAGTLDLRPQARVGRDLLFGGGTATLAGEVGRRLEASADRLDLNGPVAGDVRATVTTLYLGPEARIGGDLRYTSQRPATIAPGARVGGQIQHTTPARAETTSPVAGFVGGLIGWLRALVGLFLLGLVLVLVFPRLTQHAVRAIRGSPWADLGLGLALLIGVPIAALVAFAAGLLVGGWWLALMALALYAMVLAVGYVIAGLFLGQEGFRLLARRSVHPLVALVVGLAVLTLAGLIPYAGPVIALAAVVFGVGALVVGLWRGRPAARPA